MVKSVDTIVLDELQFRLHCGIEIVSAIQTAMAEGSSEGSCWSDALFGAVDYLGDTSKELRGLIEGEEGKQ